MRQGRESRNRGTRRSPTAGRERLESVEELREREASPGAGGELTGGDVDADRERASSSGEEAVGGTVATPDQDVVDEIGEALGVPQDPDAEVRTSQEILADRDRHYWDLERKAASDKRRR